MKKSIGNVQQKKVKMTSINLKYLLPKTKSSYTIISKKRCILIKARNKDDNYYENHQVFQHKNAVYQNDVNVEEIDDYLEAVKKMKKEDKDDYFMAYGLDYDRCFEYINVVKYQNRCWQKPYNKVNKQDIIASGRRIFNGIVFIYYFIKNEV